jgi:hypothetical protein
MHSVKTLRFYLFGILLLALVRLGGAGLLVDCNQVSLVIASTLCAAALLQALSLATARTTPASTNHFRLRAAIHAVCILWLLCMAVALNAALL